MNVQNIKERLVSYRILVDGLFGRLLRNKTARVVAVASGVLMGLVVVLGVVLNAMLTNDRLQPIAARYIDEYLDAEVKMGDIDVTFFSSFPRLGLRVRDAYIITHAFRKDSLWRSDADSLQRIMRAKADTFAVIGELRGALSLRDLLAGRLAVGRLYLENSTVRLLTDSLGHNSWDLLRADDDSAADDGQDSDSSSVALSLHKVRFSNVNIHYSDRQSGDAVFARGIDLLAEGDLALDKLDVDLDFSVRSTSVRVGGVQYCRRLPLGAKGNVWFLDDSCKYKLKDCFVNLDKIDLNVSGEVVPLDSSANLDLLFKLSSPEVKSMLDLIPADVMQQMPVKVKNGSIDFEGRVVGNIGEGMLPVMQLGLRLDDVRAKYEGMNESVEDFSANAQAKIDVSHIDSSYLHLNALHFKGGKSEFSAEAYVQKLVEDPIIKCKTDAYLDLFSLSQIFPVKNLSMNGVVDAKLGASMRLNELRNNNFASLVAAGHIMTDSVHIEYATDSLPEPLFAVDTDVDLKMFGNDTLYTMFDVKRASVKLPKIRLRVGNLHAETVTAENRADSASISTVRAKASMKRFFLRSDTVVVVGKNLNAGGEMRPSYSNPKLPYINTMLEVDTVYSGIFGTRGFTAGLKHRLWVENTSDSTWVSDGDVTINHVVVRTPAFAMALDAQYCHVTQRNTTISLENMFLKTGRSSMRVSGSMDNLYNSLMHKKNFRADIKIEADTLDVSEIMRSIVGRDDRVASNDISQGTSAAEVADAGMALAQDSVAVADSLVSKLIVIPSRIDFSLNTKVDNLFYGNLAVRDIKGDVRVANRAVHMTNLSFKQGEGRAFSTIAYCAREGSGMADVDMFIRWEKAEIDEIVKGIGLDTIVPMLKPFSGKVDCYLAAQVKCDSLYNIDLKTARAAVHIGAQRLAFLDNETFARMSKIMMFKNKQKNYIDTLSMNLMVDTGRVELLPCIINMDRYKAIAGGGQAIDMSDFSYHVSILKSPLPFKAGVTVFNNKGEVDYDITTAKLKKYATDEVMAKNDSTSLKVRVDILKHTYQLSNLPLPQYLKNL